MVEHRPWNDIIAFAILTFGVFIVAFPVYLALIASTHDAATVVGATCRFRREATPWTTTTAPSLSADRAPAASRSAICCLNSLISATGIAVGKIFISILSAYAWCISAFHSARPRSGSSSSR